MIEEQQRIAIAEACGWNFDPERTRQWKTRGKWVSGPKGVPALAFAHNIPDYLSDLNAMHEAEETLQESQRVTYSNELYDLAVEHQLKTGKWRYLSMTAAQRAEAFLRTIDKWTTTEPTKQTK